MADRPISELTELDVGDDGSRLKDESLFVLEQDGQAMSLTGESLKRYLNHATGITSVEKIGTSGLIDTYRITYNVVNNTTDFTVANAKSIIEVVKKGTSGLVDTYGIRFNEGADTDFLVTNAKSITSIEKVGTTGLVDNYVIHFNVNGEDVSYTVTNAKSITSVTYVSSTPSTSTTVGYDTYKISFNTGEEITYNAYYGKDIYLNGNPVTKYALSGDGTNHPSITDASVWKSNISALGDTRGWYIWTWDRIQYNTNEYEDRFDVSYQGRDGTGTLNSVNNVYPASGTTNSNITGMNIPVSSTDELPLGQACCVYEMTITNITTLPRNVQDANVTSDMVVVNSTLTEPNAQSGDWQITTSDGSLSISGIIETGKSTNMTLYLQKKR